MLECKAKDTALLRLQRDLARYAPDLAPRFGLAGDAPQPDGRRCGGGDRRSGARRLGALYRGTPVPSLGCDGFDAVDSLCTVPASVEVVCTPTPVIVCVVSCVTLGPSPLSDGFTGVLSRCAVVIMVLLVAFVVFALLAFDDFVILLRLSMGFGDAVCANASAIPTDKHTAQHSDSGSRYLFRSRHDLVFSCFSLYVVANAPQLRHYAAIGLVFRKSDAA